MIVVVVMVTLNKMVSLVLMADVCNIVVEVVTIMHSMVMLAVPAMMIAVVVVVEVIGFNEDIGNE